MNQKLISLFISFLSVFTVSAQGYFNKGDEQGLEIGILDLRQDSVAVLEALTGWWAESQKTLEKRMDWYTEARFGCFIHWGVYSLAGGEWDGTPVRGYAEHLMRIRKIPLPEYRERLVEPFNPVAFDADEWMRNAWFDTPHKLPLYENIRILKTITTATTSTTGRAPTSNWNDLYLF